VVAAVCLSGYVLDFSCCMSRPVKTVSVGVNFLGPSRSTQPGHHSVGR